MLHEHAIIAKKVINMDSGGNRVLVCCWDECDKPGYQCYLHISCLHDRALGCESSDRRVLAEAGQTAHLNYVFCSARHRAYWVNAAGRNALESIARTGRAYGNLPVGMRQRAG